jgi:Putative zinc dependent peptidase (DUF5700)
MASNTLSYADIPAASLSQATSLGGLAQQLTVSFGVSFGAALLDLVTRHSTPQPEVQQNWERGMSSFNQDLAALNEFFLEVLDGRLQGEAADRKAFSFFGEIQGPWYTVGYKMATLVEKRYGRSTLIRCMLDRRLLLERYNSAAEEFNSSHSDHLALWSAQVLAR